MREKYNLEDSRYYQEEKKVSHFKIRKENTINSLKEVENFLWNCKQVFKGIGAYKILKK